MRHDELTATGAGEPTVLLPGFAGELRWIPSISSRNEARSKLVYSSTCVHETGRVLDVVRRWWSGIRWGSGGTAWTCGERMAGRGRFGVGVCRAVQSPSYSYDGRRAGVTSYGTP